MQRNVILTAVSLISIVLLSLHMTDDIVYGSDKSAALNVIAVAVLAIWLYGTLALSGRRSGYAIVLLGSLVGIGVFAIHMSGGGLSIGKLAESSGAFFFIWTLLALATTSIVSAILAARELWASRR